MTMTTVVIAAPASPFGSAKETLHALLNQTRAAVDARDWKKIIDALESSLRVAQAEAPLTISEAVVVDQDHRGTGVFTAAPQGIVHDRRLRIYIEVDNFITEATTAEEHRLQLDVEGTFFLVDGNDATRIGTLPLGTHNVVTHDKRAKTSMTTDIKLQGNSPPGKYRVDVMVRDPIGGKTAQRSVIFVIAAPA
jgi:hypothetical protein